VDDAPTPPDGQPPARARRTRRNAAQRILDGAAACVIARGAAGLSLHDVAAAAGVSKALIHYHFADKESLLAVLVSRTTDGLLAREASALSGATAQGGVDSVWRWLSTELELGHLRVLTELARYPAPRVRDAVVSSRRARRTSATNTVTGLFELLALTPRVPAALLADVFVAFVDGLATHATAGDLSEHRVSFDVLWLSLISVAE
jgi:AcrR family transcriptional regulator